MEERINIEKIMEELSCGFTELQNNCENNNGYIPTLDEALNSIAHERKTKSLCFLAGHFNVGYYKEITNRNRLVCFTKRVIRKLIKFCVFPIVCEQNEVNANLLQVLNAQEREIAGLREEINKLKNSGER